MHSASRVHDNSYDQLLKRTETSNMKPNEPSRTALIIARQRVAHQVLDNGSIVCSSSSIGPFLISVHFRRSPRRYPAANAEALRKAAQNPIAASLAMGML